MSLSFRWLGVAGVELKAGGQIIALDPFFSRPSLKGLWHPVAPDPKWVAEKLPCCDVVLVTHAHWDHIMDVPEVVRHTQAVVFGSANTCQLLRVLGVPESSVTEVKAGDGLSLGECKVEVIAGQHSSIPFGRFFNGSLKPGLTPPLRLQDYRMDVCLGYRITVEGVRLLVCAAQSQPSEVLFTGAQESPAYYLSLFSGVRPNTVILIHWDDFLRPLSKPLRKFTRPGRMPLEKLTRLAQQVLPQANVIVPEIFIEYPLNN